MAAPTFFGAGAFPTPASGAGETVAPQLPAGTQPDDIAIMAVMTNQGNTFGSTGWTSLGSPANNANQSTAWYWRRLTGSGDTPTPFTIGGGTALGNTNGLYARIYVYRGCITTGTPYEGVSHAGTPTQSTGPNTSNVTTSDIDRLIISLVCVDDDNTWSSGMPPSGWSNTGGRVSSAIGGDCMMDAIAITLATAGTQTPVPFGIMSASDYWRTISLALIPAPPPVTDIDDTIDGSLVLGGDGVISSVVTIPAVDIDDSIDGSVAGASSRLSSAIGLASAIDGAGSPVASRITSAVAKSDNIDGSLAFGGGVLNSQMQAPITDDVVGAGAFYSSRLASEVARSDSTDGSSVGVSSRLISAIHRGDSVDGTGSFVTSRLTSVLDISDSIDGSLVLGSGVLNSQVLAVAPITDDMDGTGASYGSRITSGVSRIDTLRSSTALLGGRLVSGVGVAADVDGRGASYSSRITSTVSKVDTLRGGVAILDGRLVSAFDITHVIIGSSTLDASGLLDSEVALPPPIPVFLPRPIEVNVGSGSLSVDVGSTIVELYVRDVEVDIAAPLTEAAISTGLLEYDS